MMTQLIKRIRCSLGVPGYEECGSKLMKYISRSEKYGNYSFYIFLIPCIIIALLFDATYSAGNLFEKFLMLILFVISLIIISYDLTALECFFENRKESEYYLATGVTRNDILQDKGILGEFYAYVLSRKLKIPHKTLYNVCVPMPNGSYQEIDAIIITNNYMYVLECKNRSGYFTGNIRSEVWVQHIGNTENKVSNIYVQNQNHISALEHFLKTKGIISIRDFYCYNMILTGGDFVLEKIESPVDFSFGDNNLLKKYIVELDSKVDNPREEDFMEKIYMTLLPYSLNNKEKRAVMLQERDSRARNKEFARGKYEYYRFPNDVPGVMHENGVLRKDNVFTQINFQTEDKLPIWVTIPDLEYVKRG